MISSRTELRWQRIFASHAMPISNRVTGLCDIVIKEKKNSRLLGAASFNLICSYGLVMHNLGFNTENTP